MRGRNFKSFRTAKSQAVSNGLQIDITVIAHYSIACIRKQYLRTTKPARATESLGCFLNPK